MVIIEWIILAGTHQIKNRFMQHLSGCHQSINEENGCIFLLGILALFPLLIDDHSYYRTRLTQISNQLFCFVFVSNPFCNHV